MKMETVYTTETTKVIQISEGYIVPGHLYTYKKFVSAKAKADMINVANLIAEIFTRKNPPQ